VLAIHQPGRSTSPAPAAVLSLHFRHRDEEPVTATPLESAFTNCDACNPFRIRFYKNCRVSLPSPIINLKSYSKFVLPGCALCSLFSLFAQRVFDNSIAIRGICTLSEKSRGGMGISNKDLQELLAAPSRPSTRSPRLLAPAWSGPRPCRRESDLTRARNHQAPVTSHQALSLVFSHSSELFCTPQKLNSFVFNRFRTLSAKHPGGGRVVPYPVRTGRIPDRLDREHS
jgi:hypothetical protein